MTTKSDNNIAALAALFPAAFSAEPWRTHRPLKVGIGDELVARGVLGAREVNAALKQYVDRLKYQKPPAPRKSRPRCGSGRVVTASLLLRDRPRNGAMSKGRSRIPKNSMQSRPAC
jgi:ProQ/FINO family